MPAKAAKKAAKKVAKKEAEIQVTMVTEDGTLNISMSHATVAANHLPKCPAYC